MGEHQRRAVLPGIEDPVPPHRKRDPEQPAELDLVPAGSGDAQNQKLLEEVRVEENQGRNAVGDGRSANFLPAVERHFPAGNCGNRHQADAAFSGPDEILLLRRCLHVFCLGLLASAD